MKIYGLVFHDNGKVYNFKSKDEFSKGDLAVVETDKGYQIAKVSYVKDVTKDVKVTYERIDERSNAYNVIFSVDYKGETTEFETVFYSR